MTPDKAATLAKLTAERFPCPDVLEAELRQPNPETLRAEKAMQLAAAELSRIQADDPAAVKHRRGELDAWPSDAQIARRAEARRKRLVATGRVA